MIIKDENNNPPGIGLVRRVSVTKMKHQNKYLGRRKPRGLFHSSTGVIINADVNGALGILLKEEVC